MLRRLLRPTNRRVRVVVGLFLAGLFCVQCAPTEALVESKDVVVISGRDFGRNAPEIAARIEQLAKTDHISLLEYCLANYSSSYRDLTCTLIKQERIDGRCRPQQTIDVKHMTSPFSVAMAWTKNPPAGDRVVFVEGRNNNQMLVRPQNELLRALVGGSVLRQPDGKEALRSALRPVNMFGFGRALESLISVYRKAQTQGDLKTAHTYAKVGGRKCIVLMRYLPAKDDYPAYKTFIYIDVEYLAPIRIEAYDWDGRLQSLYDYRNIKFNVGLSEDDFTPQANGIAVGKTP